MKGCLVISLDFELLWGVRDHMTRDHYGANILGAREAIPRMLDIFAENGIRATWATVGFLFCESKDELLQSLPEERPSYSRSSLSNYEYLDEVGRDEASDPYYFAPSLIRKIADTPGQEIGTHTLSHYYCLEPGSTASAFEADLIAAKKIAERRGLYLRSIVFPRNQYSKRHLSICDRLGITAYRGNPSSWAYRATRGIEQTSLRRLTRLLDAYSGILGANASRVVHGQPSNIPASRFLRPCAGRLAPFHPLHLNVVERGMTEAALGGTVFHLWWHPHNFGIGIEQNLSGLKRLIGHFCRLRDEYQMASWAMGELA